MKKCRCLIESFNLNIQLTLQIMKENLRRVLMVKIASEQRIKITTLEKA